MFDSHLHLTDYESETDIGVVIAQARAVGVTRLVCNGTSEVDWGRVLDLARDHLEVTACLGLHPWFVTRRSEHWLETLNRLVADNRCGVGEIGLDRSAEPLDVDAQEDAFRAQLNLAREHRRPAIIHCVKAWGWLMDILLSEAKLPCGMLIHAYGGSVDLIKPLAEMGAYFSFSGKVLEPNYARSRSALMAVPRDRLLLETDAPNMLPPPQAKRYFVQASHPIQYNHPANLPAISEGVAGLLNEPLCELQGRVWQNSQRFFGPIL